jgi:hypothetical protein
MTHLTNILRNPPPNLNIEEVEKEIFGRLGHKDASRFFIKPDEMTRQEQQLMDQIQQQQQIIEELKAVLDKNTADNMTKLQIASMKEEGANIRKEAELETNVTLEQIKLLNPVQGEKKVG